MNPNYDLQALGAAGVVLGLGMLWFYLRDLRNQKYSATEWRQAMRERNFGTYISDTDVTR